MKTDDFDRYLVHLAAAVAHVDRVGPMKDYCTGLMLPLQRKSVEPMAAHLSPRRVSAKHQSLLHFVGQSDWSDQAMLSQVLAWVQPLISHEVIINLIANTTSTIGLTIHAELDCGTYPTDIKVGNKELTHLALKTSHFHGDWNYALLPESTKTYLS